LLSLLGRSPFRKAFNTAVIGCTASAAKDIDKRPPDCKEMIQAPVTCQPQADAKQMDSIPAFLLRTRIRSADQLLPVVSALAMFLVQHFTVGHLEGFATTSHLFPAHIVGDLESVVIWQIVDPDCCGAVHLSVVFSEEVAEGFWVHCLVRAGGQPLSLGMESVLGSTGKQLA
jgi:hypothetical protein